MLRALNGAATLFIVILSLSKGGYAAEPSATPAPATETLRVQVIGSVPKPGNVTLPAGSRLSDALAAAGLRLRTSGETLQGATLADIADCRQNPAELQVYFARGNGVQPAIYQITVRQGPTDQRYDPLMRDDDKIFVASACRSAIRIIKQYPE